MTTNTSDGHCALVCMIVSNPGSGERRLGWQKVVNDLIRALRDERNAFREVLHECEVYFDNRADADCEGDPAEFVPNREMILLSAIRDALAKAEGLGQRADATPSLPTPSSDGRAPHV